MYYPLDDLPDEPVHGCTLSWVEIHGQGQWMELTQFRATYFEILTPWEEGAPHQSCCCGQNFLCSICGPTKTHRDHSLENEWVCFHHTIWPKCSADYVTWRKGGWASIRRELDIRSCHKTPDSAAFIVKHRLEDSVFYQEDVTKGQKALLERVKSFIAQLNQAGHFDAASVSESIQKEALVEKEALAKRCAAVIPQWGGGMSIDEFMVIDDNRDGTVTALRTSHNAIWDDLDPEEFLPILTAPATLGWLTCFVREVWGRAWAEPQRDGTWIVLLCREDDLYSFPIGERGTTEAEAVISALESAKELGMTTNNESENYHANR